MRIADLTRMAALLARAVSVQGDDVNAGGKMIAEVAAAGWMQCPAALVQVDHGSGSCIQVSAVQRVADDRGDARHVAARDALRAADLITQEEPTNGAFAHQRQRLRQDRLQVSAPTGAKATLLLFGGGIGVPEPHPVDSQHAWQPVCNPGLLDGADVGRSADCAVFGCSVWCDFECSLKWCIGHTVSLNAQGLC